MIQSTRHKTRLFHTLVLFILAVPLIYPSYALSDYALLKKFIIAYNLEASKKSLMDESYRGEEGILRIRPEIARSLGMRVFIDPDYMSSRKLFEQADKLLEKSKDAMSTDEKAKFQGEHAQKIADYFLSFQKNIESARKKLAVHRTRVNSDNDERLDETACNKVMDRLLERSLKKTATRLRDALGHFYNVCQGGNRGKLSLTPENVSFVNYVFHNFTKEASANALRGFDLDRDDRYDKEGLSYNWKRVIGKDGARYAGLVEATIEKLGDKIYRIDPLLFLALMKRESNFDPLAVSPMGAAGLTQIMPRTAKDLGMKNIYVPSYFGKAIALIKLERKKKNQAMAALFQITETDKLHHAKRARELMQESLRIGRERDKLFTQYRKELLQKGTDERLQPSKAIESGLKYFARLMKNQKGDMSLALASYNAGSHRVRTFKGIPPYDETVLFRNKVLEYYWNYLRKAKRD